jgi:hypothetical protein
MVRHRGLEHGAARIQRDHLMRGLPHHPVHGGGAPDRLVEERIASGRIGAEVDEVLLSCRRAQSVRNRDARR